MRSVPIDQHIPIDNRSPGTSFEGGDIRSSELEESVVGQPVRPRSRAVVTVRIVGGSDIVRLAVIIPGDDLKVTKFWRPISEVENLLPPLVPESLGFEQPVLAVRHFLAKVSKDCRFEKVSSARGLGSWKENKDGVQTHTKGKPVPCMLFPPHSADRYILDPYL